MGSPSAGGARLLPDSARVRFLPKLNFSGTVQLLYRAWDQTAGESGGTLNVIGNRGGAGALSIAEERASLAVLPVNDAPVLKISLNPVLTTVAEDATNPGSTLVASLLTGAVTDPDAAALRGIAVTAAALTNGAWQYSLNGGASWTAMGAVSSTAALLLPSTARIRFLPKLNFAGQVKLYYHAWDQTAGSPGGTLSVNGNSGGSHCLSLDKESAALTVTAVNDAPLLNAAFNPLLTQIAEDATGHAGTSVSALIKDAVTDVDAAALRGIAVTAASGLYGAWQYSLDGGATWIAMGTPSSSTALLLPSSAKVRFVPKLNYNGSVKLFYRAWDQTAGEAGGLFSVSGNTGGTKSLSTTSDYASLTVTPVNDKPVLGGISGSVSYVRNAAALVLAGSATVTDVDSESFFQGRLRVRITTGMASSNRLSIGGGFTVDAQGNVRQGTTLIGKRVSSGFGTSELVVTFSSNATKSLVQQLIRSIMFKTVNGSSGQRKVLFSVSDGDGGVSAEVSRTVNVT
jgi:hypothetical protein